MLDEFGKVVDKVEVTIYTKEEDVVRLEEELVRPIYNVRDDRLNSLTDESGCILHLYTVPVLCSLLTFVVTPERLGSLRCCFLVRLKATKELTQPVLHSQSKRTVLSTNLGAWEEVNDVVASAQGAVEKLPYTLSLKIQ